MDKYGLEFRKSFFIQVTEVPKDGQIWIGVSKVILELFTLNKKTYLSESKQALL